MLPLLFVQISPWMERIIVLSEIRPDISADKFHDIFLLLFSRGQVAKVTDTDKRMNVGPVTSQLYRIAQALHYRFFHVLLLFLRQYRVPDSIEYG